MSLWVAACAAEAIECEEAKRFDHTGRTFAIYHSPDGEFFCTDGLCTHEAVHLADGLVMDYTIECPKHAGLFDYRTGEAKRLPPCRNLVTYPVKVEDGMVYVDLQR
jgi:3-phenylpropionate/trans-cinnamate dioxygenase ferredoxin subunit